MENKNLFSDYIIQTLAGLTVFVVGGIVGLIIAYIKSEKFRKFIERIIIPFIKLASFIKNNLKNFIWIMFLIVIEIILWFLYLDWRVVILSLLHVALIFIGLILLIKQTTHLDFVFPKKKKKFQIIPIPPGIGNKIFQKYYVDAPSGNISLGGVEFNFSPNSLVFDTGSHIRDYIQRDEGSIEVRFKLSEPIDNIKSVHLLINSGNSSSICAHRTIGDSTAKT